MEDEDGEETVSLLAHTSSPFYSPPPMSATIRLPPSSIAAMESSLTTESSSSSSSSPSSLSSPFLPSTPSSSSISSSSSLSFDSTTAFPALPPSFSSSIPAEYLPRLSTGNRREQSQRQQEKGIRFTTIKGRGGKEGPETEEDGRGPTNLPTTIVYFEEPEKRQTPWLRIFLASFNFINATIGAGILGLPKMVSLSGGLLGPLLIVAIALLSNYSLRLLHDVSLISGQRTYEAVATHLHSALLGRCVTVAIVFINFGALIAYMIVSADFLLPIMYQIFGADSIFYRRDVLTALVAVIGFLPLSLLKNISSLQWTSMASIFLTFGFVLIVIVRCFVPNFNSEQANLIPTSLDFFQGLGIALFAFDCSSNLIPICVELEDDNTRRNVAKVITSTTTVSCTSYLLVGIFGFLSFYAQTDGNILNNYPPSDVLIGVMRGIMTINIICTFPLAMYPCRISIDTVVVSNRITAKLCWNSSAALPVTAAKNAVADETSPPLSPSSPFLSIPSTPEDLETIPLIDDLDEDEHDHQPKHHQQHHHHHHHHQQHQSHHHRKPRAATGSQTALYQSSAEYQPPSSPFAATTSHSRPHLPDATLPTTALLHQQEPPDDLIPEAEVFSILPREEYFQVGWVAITKWRLRFLTETAILMVLAYLLAVFLPSVDFVFSIVGSTASACLSYIFPALIWLSARSVMTEKVKQTLYYRRNCIVCPLLIVLGIVLGVFGTVMTILMLF